MAKHYSNKQRQDLRASRLEQARERLEAGVAELLTDGNAWTRWLQLQSKLHRYSFNNVMLILQQRPDATMVAGFNKWVELGRHVRKGEQAIWILAPFTRKRDEVDDETGEETQVRSTYFAPVPVFDLSQTDGDPLPVPPTPVLLEGDSPELRDRFATVARALEADGWTVKVEANSLDANGVTYWDRKLVSVRPGMSDAQSLKTLVHEWAHATLHADVDRATVHRGRREVEADSVAFLVLAGIGVDSSSYSFPYVAGWSEGDPKVVVEVAQRVNTAAQQLLERLEDVDPSEIVSLLGPALEQVGPALEQVA